MAPFQQLLMSPAVVLISFLLLPLYCLLVWRSKSNKEAPEPAGAWPIIGHLHLLANGALPHITLATMADSYGPAFMLRLGMRRALVVSDWETAKECLTVNDKAFATRPSLVAIKLMGYNDAMLTFAPYGPYWRKLRKIVVLELLSNNRLQSFNHIWSSEIYTSMNDLYGLWTKHEKAEGPDPVLVDLKQWFGYLTLNVALRLVAGKRYFGTTGGCEEGEAQRCKSAMNEFIRLGGLFVLSDSFPFLGWLDLQGYEKVMKTTAKDLDNFLQGWLDEHRTKRQSDRVDDNQDLMDLMLSVLEDSKLYGYDADTINKATCLSIILGGSDTTAVTLTWAISLLLNHPQALRKARDELDVHVGTARHVDESDIKNLTYLQAIVKETMRLYPAVPLSAPHEAIEECMVSGYKVPAGTRLIMNLWKIQRDPRVWSNPLEFQPERFLTSHADIDVKGQHFQLIPFGSGRRSCPGMSLALQVVQLTLAHTLQGFEFATGSGAPVDMTGSPGLSNQKATPLEVLITPRLPSNLYNVN